jgi:NadR type nicotinamide-nucleotide adenylyltransferase
MAVKKQKEKKRFLSIRKVVVIGPESTGKSTLSKDLATALQTIWVPEYAREYLEHLGRPYTETDLLEIAKGQVQNEDQLAAQVNELLICDTDLHVVKVWSQHKYGRCHKWILEEIARRDYDLYLLTYIDVIWEDDPLREHPEEGQRHYFYNIYKDIVQQSGLPWADIRGNNEQRLQTAMAAIKQYLT